MTTNTRVLLGCTAPRETVVTVLENWIVTLPGGETVIGHAEIIDGIIYIDGYTAAVRDCVIRANME